MYDKGLVYRGYKVQYIAINTCTHITSYMLPLFRLEQ